MEAHDPTGTCRRNIPPGTLSDVSSSHVLPHTSRVDNRNNRGTHLLSDRELVESAEKLRAGSIKL